MIWRCPRCRGELVEVDNDVACNVCEIRYPSFEGIFDFRLARPSWIDYEEDRAQARQLIAETVGFSAEETVRYVFDSDALWKLAGPPDYDFSLYWSV